MYRFIFTKNSQKSFDKLSCEEKDRIISKLQNLKQVGSIYNYLRVVYDLLPATHRLRIGNYRLLLKIVDNNEIHILKIGHRREIYRQ